MMIQSVIPMVIHAQHGMTQIQMIVEYMIRMNSYLQKDAAHVVMREVSVLVPILIYTNYVLMSLDLPTKL